MVRVGESAGTATSGTRLMSSTSEYAAIVPESVTDADASYVIEAVESVYIQVSPLSRKI
jgi:hypothetical protein